MAEVLKRQVIIPTGQTMDWLNARGAVKDKGGLPSNVLYDDILVRSDEWQKPRGYYAFWAREVLVYPKKNGQFRKGADVVDAVRDNAGREWVFPASSMPEEAVGREKVGLFVDPQNIELNSNRVIILAEPKSILILTPFIQINGSFGIVDEATRVPLEVTQEISGILSEAQKRWLRRIDGAGVIPLVRGVGDYLDRRVVYANDRQDVDAGDWHDYGFGVAFVELRSEDVTAPEI